MWVATQIDTGCDCCSYHPIGAWERHEDVPTELWADPNIELEDDDDA